jgi:hypothetical protein
VAEPERYEDPKPSMMSRTAPLAEALNGKTAKAISSMTGSNRIMIYLHRTDI